jgi:hypothetical protein
VSGKESDPTTIYIKEWSEHRRVQNNVRSEHNSKGESIGVKEIATEYV